MTEKNEYKLLKIQECVFFMHVECSSQVVPELVFQQLNDAM